MQGSAVGQSVPARLSRARFCLAVMLGVYPVVTALLYVVLPLTEEWPLFLKTVMVVPPTAVIMVWAIIPRIHRHLHVWLHPASPRRPG